ncbi:uncharacterized protein J4E79_011022 [Alternaria viburni]|uniref:uncharacterized protein n=1 Tax=Alternaria viburni TaxID=566460 RepID=UPI0020C448F8|nr:uncharacterized protein J4E79_011022 [Alternaria viburni]KAI4644585.1 hypothetical protein J4E79_011022 [Alternaria viburni]
MEQADFPKNISRGFASLPLELFLNVLDQLVGTHNGQHPVAYAPSNIITKTLRALTLVSRNTYLIATQLVEGNYTPLVRLPQIIDLLSNLISLKRLALDLSPIYAPPSEVEQIRPHVTVNRVFSHMSHLEELIVSYDVVNYFRHPPPNLKRLAITTQEMSDLEIAFCLKTPSLQALVMMRPVNLAAKTIDSIFRSYDGKSLDVVLVDVNSNHRTPHKTRNWTHQDTVRIWEADVPVSFYGDEDDIILCDAWIWNHGVGGTLWSQDKRRMASWEEIEKRLAGPVHTIVDL